MPRVSIITAAYIDSQDKARWIGEAADSLLRQTMDDWEWVVVDDASPYPFNLPSDVRIRIDGFRAVNRSGPAMCRNTAAALARSDVLLPLDADDLLPADALELMYSAWASDVDSFVYGYLQIVENGVPGKVVNLGQYTFQESLKPKGVIPVTALHPKEAWKAVGGWKPELEYGLEDVEYWISLGERGYCGNRLPVVTLLYRKHPNSRTETQLKVSGARTKDMTALIRSLHKDSYEGRLPMGCCGGGRSGPSGGPLPIPNTPIARTIAPKTLDSATAVWVRYNGAKNASFFVRGKVTGAQYEVRGSGDLIHIYAEDAHFFRNLGRGKDFSVGVPGPEPVREPEPVAVAPPKPPEPPPIKMATIFGTPPPKQKEPVFVEMPEVETDAVVEVAELQKEHPLEAFDWLGEVLTAKLEGEGWTVPQLARALPEELTPYKGIGPKTAERLIDEAKELWST